LWLEEAQNVLADDALAQARADDLFGKPVEDAAKQIFARGIGGDDGDVGEPEQLRNGARDLLERRTDLLRGKNVVRDREQALEQLGLGLAALFRRSHRPIGIGIIATRADARPPHLHRKGRCACPDPGFVPALAHAIFGTRERPITRRVNCSNGALRLRVFSGRPQR